MIKPFQTEVYIHCRYENQHFDTIGSVYACVSRLMIMESDRKVIGVSKYPANNDEEYVNYLQIADQEVGFIPEEINVFFAYIIGFQMNNCSLKDVSKNELKSFPNLKLLDLSTNKLESLRADLFEYSTNLIWVSFEKNNIVTVGAEIFKSLHQLEQLNFSSNSCIDENADSVEKVEILIPKIAFKCSYTIQEIRNEIAAEVQKQTQPLIALLLNLETRGLAISRERDYNI